MKGLWRRLRTWWNELFISVQEVQQAGLGKVGGVGEGLTSNVVMAPVQWVQRAFTQAEAIVEEKVGPRRWEYVDEHPLEELLRNPNEFYDGDTLTKAVILSWLLDGNTYVRKARDRQLRVRELWYLPHWMVTPEYRRDGRGPFVTHYAYRPVNGEPPESIPVSEIVHLRHGLDPRNPRKGLSPIAAALREVLTDEEASAFSAYLLSNMGVPGGIIAPKDSEHLPDEEAIGQMKAYMESGFTGKKRGNWLVLGVPTEVKQFGFDPNRLMVGPLRDISEERICAMIGVPAAVVGFGAGLQQTKVGATMRELVRLARVSCIEPNQLTLGRQLSRQLLPDFEPRPAAYRVVYDNSGASMFQEDETALAKRAGQLYGDGLAYRNEARSMVGLDELEEDGFKSELGGGAGAAERSGGRGEEEEVDDEEDGGDGDGAPGLFPPEAMVNRLAGILQASNGDER